MRINYNRSGNERKLLVAKIAELTGEKPVYLKTPTYSYQIGPFNIGRYGLLTCEDWADDSAKELAGQLEAAGFEGEIEEPEDPTAETDTEAKETESEEAPAGEESEQTPVVADQESPAEDTPDEDETEPEDESDGTEPAGEEPAGLTIEMPLDKVAVGTLTNILTAKGTLIRKALGIDVLRIEVKDDKVSFPWFKELPDPDETKAYTMFISLLCKFSKELKRASANETPVTNEKYAFRCFLLRLGFIGADYKAERKILLQNLSGNSSWKNGAPEKAAALAEEPTETTEDASVEAAEEKEVAVNA